MKLLLLIFLLAATTAFSQTNGWRQLNGPYNGAFAQVVVGNDNDIYAVTIEGYLYARHSGSWSKLTPPTNAGSGYYLALALDNEKNLFFYNTYAGATSAPGIYKSTDLGISWISTLSIPSIQKIITAKSGNLYAFQGGPYNGSNTVIFKSTNHGDSWNLLTSIPLQSAEFLVDQNEQCYFSTSSSKLEVIQYDPVTDYYYSYTSSFVTGGKVYLCQLHDTLIAKTSDAIYFLNPLKVWKKQGEFLSPTSDTYTWRSSYPIFISEATNRLYATGKNAGAYEIFSSADLGKTWQAFPPNTPEIYWALNLLAVDGNGAVYDVGINNPIGVWKSDDLGTSWEQIGKPYDITFFQEGPNKSLFVMKGNSAPLLQPQISFNHGDNWDKLSSYFPTTDANEYGSFAKDFNGGFIFLSTVRGLLYSEPPLFDNFELQNFAFGGIINASAASKKNCFIQTTSTSAIFASSDHGISWEEINYPNTGTTAYPIFNTDADGALYLGSFPSLYKSTDEGKTWTKIETGLKNAGISVIRFDGARILLGTTGSGIWHSRDNGSTWSKWLDIPTDSVIGLERYGDKYYCATSIGVYSCPFEGTSWTPELFANEQIYINSLLKTSDGKLYASVRDRGLWAFDESVRSVSEKTLTEAPLRIVTQNSQTIIVAFDASGERSELSLYNILGNRIWNTSHTASSESHSIAIPITSLPTGMYYITLRTSKGSASTKVLIHR